MSAPAFYIGRPHAPEQGDNLLSDAAHFAQDIITLHQEAHQQMRGAIAGLDSAALNWMPGPETSSIALIVVHSMGAQAEVLRNLPGIPTQRVRDDEFSCYDHRRTSWRR